MGSWGGEGGRGGRRLLRISFPSASPYSGPELPVLPSFSAVEKKEESMGFCLFKSIKERGN